MSRKNLFSDLPTPVVTPAPPPHARPLQGSTKPMSAIKRSVGDLNDRSRRADEIEKSLMEGQAVIEIDAGIIEPSFVRDRMDGDIEGLKTSIAEQGQQVPILVRLHPEFPDKYQVAFGHRRLRALKELGIKAKAIVRELTDEQLVIAQGQENNERADLTYIEKARFAANLKDRFTREIIVASMSIDRADISRMMALVDALPPELVDAIGPAPGLGRGSWQQLAELVDKFPERAKVLDLARSLSGLPSEERFKKVIIYLKPARPERGVPVVLSTSSGGRLAQLKNSRTKLEITIDKKATPDFATFVLERLASLYEEHQASKEKQKEA